MARGPHFTGEVQFTFRAETLGSWAKVADAQMALFLESQWRATKEDGDMIKEAARDTVRKAPIKGARRMATSWRGQIYPTKPPPYSRRPAYVLGTNAQMPLDHLESGIVITAKGAGLMIPIGEAAKFKQPAFTEQAGRLARVIAAMTAKYGKLSWAEKRGQLYYGAWTRNRAGKDRFIALFIVRRSVTIPKKLDTRATIARLAQGAPQRVADKTMQRFSAGHDAAVTRAVSQR